MLHGGTNTAPDLRRDPQGWFRHFDRDGNGLEQHEVTDALVSTLPGLTPVKAAELIRDLWPLFDTDRSGSISMREFTKRDGLREAILANLRATVEMQGYPAGGQIMQGIVISDPTSSKGTASSSSASGHCGGKGLGKTGGKSLHPPCERCGRTNHRTADCYARIGPSTGGKGELLGDGPPCQKCGRNNHRTSECYARVGKGTTGQACVPCSSTNPGGVPSFGEVLEALRPFHRRLGGTPFFGRRDPHIPKKLSSSELTKNSNYEYVFLTVLGFQFLHMHKEEIISLNNGQHFKTNPGTKRLEEVCGFTMHADRPGANGILRSAPEVLLRAFDVARRKRIVEEFFTGEAFDRMADPCLEGRLGRILAFLEVHAPRDEESPCNVCSGTGRVTKGLLWSTVVTCKRCKGTGRISGAPSDSDAPPSDVAVETMPEGSPPEKVVGEYLRVFRNLCIQRWARSSGLAYARAKSLWEKAEAGTPEGGEPVPEVQQLLNSQTFTAYLMQTGIVAGRPAAGGGPPCARCFPETEVRRAVNFYVEMETLSPGS